MDEMQERQMLPMGTLLQDGKYRVVRYMASGGFGNTYEVEHVKLHKRMAMKEFYIRGINQRQGVTVSVSLEENRTTFNQMRAKFYNEAKRLASLEEQHVVDVSDFFEENQTAYYVMRLVEGESLDARMKRTGQPLSEQEVRQVVLPQVLAALKYVHGQNINHLDLKPANIMQDEDGHCWLIDFGASKQISAEESHTLGTGTGLCYTPDYAPSEQVNGNARRIGPWTDFYALGATLYNLLTTKKPPSSDDIMDEGVSAFKFPASVSPDMRSLITWLMSPAPKDRPQRVEDIEQRLATAAPGPAPKPGPTPKPGPAPVPDTDSAETRLASGPVRKPVPPGPAPRPVPKKKSGSKALLFGCLGIGALGLIALCVIGAVVWTHLRDRGGDEEPPVFVSGDTYLTVSDDELYFESGGGTQTIIVGTSGSWWISTDADSWGHLTQDGNQLEVRIDENTSHEERTDFFIITAGDKEQRVNITQAGAPIVWEVSGTSRDYTDNAKALDYIVSQIEENEKCRLGAITENGEGVVIYENNGAFMMSLPTNFSDKIKSINERISSVALTHSGYYCVVYERNAWYGYVPDQMKTKLNEFNANAEEILAVSISENGDFAIVTDEHFFASNSSDHSNMTTAMEKYGKIKDVCITNLGICVVCQNGIYYDNIPSNVEAKLKGLTFHPDHVSYTDSGTFLITDESQTYAFRL